MQKYLLICLISVLSISGYSQKPELIIPSFHSASVNDIECSPDGSIMVSGGSDQVLKIWDYNKGKELKAIPTQDDINDINISGNGKYVIATDKAFLYLVDLDQIKLIRKIKLEKRASTVDISKDGQTIYYAYNDDKVQKIFKCNQLGQNKQLIFEKPVKAYYVSINKIDLSPDERFLMIKDRDDDYLLNLSTLAAPKKATGAMFFLPNNWLLKFDKKSFSAVDPVSGAQKWKKTFTSVSGSSDAWPHRKFFLDKTQKTLSFSMTYGENELLLYGNYESGIFKEKRNFLNIKNSEVIRIAQNQGDIIVQTAGPYSFKVMDLQSLKVKRSFGAALMMTRHMDVAENGFTFSFGSVFNKKVKRVHFENGQLKVQTLATPRGQNHVRISEDGLFTAVTNPLSKNKFIRVFKEDQLIYTSPKYSLEEKPLDIGISPKGRYLASLSFEKLKVTDLQTGNVLFSKSFAGEFKKYTNGKIVFSPDKLLIQYDSNIASATNSSERRTFKCYSLSSQSLLWTQTAAYENVKFTPKGNLIATKNYKELLSLNSSSGAVVQSSPISGKLGYNIDYSYNQSFSTLALSNDIEIDLVDINSKQKIGSLKGATAKVWSLGFYNQEFLISSGDDNVIRIWDVKNNKLLAQMIIYDTTDDWVIVTPDGLFDGSEAAISQMYYTKGKTFIPLEQLYERFYTPNLLEQLISREIEPAPIVIDEIKSPPTVKMEYRSGQRNLVVEDDVSEEQLSTDVEEAIIKVSANAPNDRIEEIRLFHNGKLVGSGNRGLVVEDEQPGEKEQSYTIKLLPGENTFRAIALNSQRTESAPALLRIKYTPKANAPTPATTQAGMTLHLVVVGINEYKNRKYNLNYANADAEAFKSAIAAGMKEITSKENIHFVSNANADKAGILKAIKTVQSEANPQDVFVFYYAGHGVMSEGIGNVKKDFYLVPHDVTQLYGADDALAQKGISASEMKELASSIAAQKQLFILDACQSAGAIETIAMRGAAEEKAIAQLARSTGTHWLTASGSEQYATEFAQLGHGVFTYALLEGLKGKADSGDKRVTINELKAYLETQVPELTQQYKGTPQYPASYGYGQDFPVSIVPK